MPGPWTGNEHSIPPQTSGGGGGGGAPSGSAGGDLGGTYPNPTVNQASAAWAQTGIISPAAIAARQDNWNPTGLSGASIIRATATGAQTITGLQGGAAGRIIKIINIGASIITLTSESASSTAGNRFLCPPAGIDVQLQQYDVATLTYDSTTSRWRVEFNLVSEDTLLLTDSTTANATTSQHGFLKKLSNTATEFMNGQGNWAVPAVTTDATLTTTDVTTNDVTTSKHGFAVKAVAPGANQVEAMVVLNGETAPTWRAITDTTNPANIGTAAPGTATTAAHRDHVHATGAGVPTTQAFGDAAATGSGPAASMTDHKHAMMANPMAPMLAGAVDRQTMAGNVNDYAVGAATTVISWDTGGAARNLTGIVASTDGRMLYLINSAGGTNNITLVHDATSTAANRFYCTTGTDVKLRPREGVWVQYDATLQRWMVGHTDMPNAGPDGAVVADTGGAAGTLGQYTRAGHGHQIATYSSTPAAATSTGSAGTSGQQPNRGDHAHPFGTTTKSIYILPGDFYDGTTPAVPAKLGTAPDAILASAALSASATSNLLWSFVVPQDWASGAITYIIFWSATTGDATPHTIRWSMDVKEIVVGTTAYDAAGTSTAFTGSSAARTAKVIYTEAAQTLLTPSAAGVLVRCGLQRLGADAADTMTDTANVHMIQLKYTGSE